MIEEIVEWHKKTFPDATFESQILKLEEELFEYNKSYDEEELADVLIVSIVLAKRFKSQIGYDIFAYYYDKCCDELIIEKMKINKKRTWHKVNGVYRHV